ncbi:hypothetical protein OIU76_022138 [Salix suchowensis]|nr:hypothetical protein OIU76_022138 [Salix suchowensis]
MYPACVHPYWFRSYGWWSHFQMGFHNTNSNEGLANEGQSEDSEPDQGGEESDSSEDEVAPRNTVGDVPLEWYRDEKHIGYDIAGKKLKKKERQDKLDSFLANVDNLKNW